MSAAASLVVLKGPRKQAAAAMKLTIMELVAGGLLTIARRPTGRGKLSLNDREATVAWVPEGARAPDDPALLSVFAAAGELSSEADAATIIDIARRAQWIAGNPAGSTIDAWLYRFPLKDLYDRGLMATRARLMRRDKADLTPEGRRLREQLQQRLESIRPFLGKDEHVIESLLGGEAFRTVRLQWPDIDAFTRVLGSSRGGVGVGGAGPG